jgi:hypothetical protein
MVMNAKPSTAALDSFRHESFLTRRRAPRHPAGENICLSSGHGFSHAAVDGHYKTHCHPERSEGVDSHFKCNSSEENISAGVWKPRHFRGV